MANIPADEIARFYSPASHPDSAGRTLSSILAYSDQRLERDHDFIQVLFPLPERSPISPHAPLITESTQIAFEADPVLRRNLLLAFERMAKFYSFEVSSAPCGAQDGSARVPLVGQVTLTPIAGFEQAARRTWLMPFGHNHLRISRIIRCLRVLGLPTVAETFYETLKSYSAGIVSARSLMYWERAANRMLHLPPSEDDTNALGIAWLRQG